MSSKTCYLAIEGYAETTTISKQNKTKHITKNDRIGTSMKVIILSSYS